MKLRAFGRGVLGMLIPAAAAALLVFALMPREQTGGPSVPAGELKPPTKLARMAATAPLKPIVLRDGRSQLGRTSAGEAPPEQRPAPPRRLEIPALGIEADVQNVSSTETGIEVPQVGHAGWFDEGPRPGEAGRSVLIGHLDSHTGPGLFALLPGVDDGTEVSVTDEDGETHRFEVVGKAQVPKETFPNGAVYGPSPRPVLVLITCGGPYTQGVGYRDNVLVYARAVAN